MMASTSAQIGHIRSGRNGHCPTEPLMAHPVCVYGKPTRPASLPPADSGCKAESAPAGPRRARIPGKEQST